MEKYDQEKQVLDSGHCATLHSEPLPEEDEVMTTLQMISFMVMPVAGLLLAGAVLFYDWRYPAKHQHRHDAK